MILVLQEFFIFYSESCPYVHYLDEDEFFNPKRLKLLSDCCVRKF
jgi:hypothetical protein